MSTPDPKPLHEKCEAKLLSGIECSHCKGLLKAVHEAELSELESRVALLEGMCERAKRQLEYVASGHSNDGDAECWLSDYASGIEGKECKTNTPQT